MARKYELTESEAALVFEQISDHCQSLKNYITYAVEAGEFDRAQRIVLQLRAYQVLYAKLNVEAHRLIDAAREGKG